MKRHLVVATVLAFGFLTCSLSTVALAQEEAAEEGEIEYSWGIVSSVSSDQIIVKEYDYNSDEEVNVIYTIDPEVELANVSLLKDIVQGDTVDIEYVIKGDKKIARFISVEKAYDEKDDEYMPSESYE